MYADWIDVKTLKRRHRYFSRSGFYLFLFKNIIKILLILLAIVLIFVGLEKWVIDLEVVFNAIFKQFSTFWVLTIFTISESVFGLIPPDFFILWSRQFSNPWLMVSILAGISYIGGVASYYIGQGIRRIPRINLYLNKKFSAEYKKVKRWGAVFIIIAALFPIPYSVVCMLSGTLNFPAKVFYWLGLFRVARFYSYALVLFGLLN